MARKKVIKMTPKLEDFIFDKMTTGDGMLPKQIFDKYEDQLPSLSTFNRKQVDDASFKAKVDAAYSVYYQIKQAKLELICNMTAFEVADYYKKNIDKESRLGFAQAAEFKKTLIDTIKFDLGKLAGIMTPRYNSKQVVEHSGTVQSDQTVQFMISNYAIPAELDITPEQLKLDN